MAGIRSGNTKPEKLVRKGLHSLGYRYRLHCRRLSGKPDIVLPKWKAAIFINGCFWHGHDCELFRLPSTRSDFWQSKIEANRLRDARNLSALGMAGWRVLTIWECAIRGKNAPGAEETIGRADAWLRGNFPTAEIRGCSLGAR